MTRRLIALILALIFIMSVSLSLAEGGISPKLHSAAISATTAAAPKKIKIEGPTIVAKGKKITLKAVVTPNAASQDVVWSSSNKKIATVSSKGVVKGLKPGKVKITAVSKKNKKVKKTYTVQIVKHAVTSVSITGTVKKLDLSGKKTVKLKAKALPADASQEFVWESSNPKVAAVSKDGKVTAKKTGKVKITATARDGSKKKKTITIQVIDSAEEPTPTPKPDEPTPTPEPEEDYDPDWDSSVEDDPDSEDPGEVFEYSIKAGGVHITGYTGKKATVEVPAEINGVKVSQVRLQVSEESAYRITKVVLPDQPIILADNALSGLRNLAEVEGLKNVTRIGPSAFNTTSLRKLVFSKKLKYIAYDAFSGCVVKEITIPDDVTYEPGAFRTFCVRKFNLINGTGSATIIDVDGVLYSADQSELLCYPPNISGSSFHVPDGTGKIGAYAFCLVDNLQEIAFPESVTELDDCALYNIEHPIDLLVHEGSAAHTYVKDRTAHEKYFRCILVNSEGETLEQFVARIVRENASSGSDYDKALALHDWLIAYAEYDWRESGIAYTTGGEMLRYGKGVCAAYASAYQILLEAAGIECKRVGNSIHEFDAVKVGNDWMYVDCTWDDMDSDAMQNHRYFGFEDTIRYAVYGADDPETLDDIIIDTDSLTVRQCKYHYWIKNGYCKKLISATKKAVQEQLDAGNHTFTLPLQDDSMSCLLTAAAIRNAKWEVNSAETIVHCTWSNDILYCIRQEKETDTSDFQYDIRDNKIRILKYTGNDRIVVIPARIDGLPVGFIGAAFDRNTTVASVVLPNTVTEIEGNAFRGATSLQKINFPKNLKVIGDNAFSFCISLSSDVTLPEGFISLGFAAFNRCIAIRNVSLPSTVQMTDLSFLDCSGIKKLTLANGIRYIPSSAFSGASSLKSVKLPVSLEEIGHNAFYGTGLTELAIPKNVSWIGTSPIQCCTNLTKLTVDSKNPYYKSSDNIVFTADGKTICFSAVNAGAETYTIPAGVTALAERAFCGNRKIKNLVIPGSVKSIGTEAFTGSFDSVKPALESVTIGNGCETIGQYCFIECTNLTKLKLPDSIVSLGQFAFFGAPIEELHIPKGITCIPASLFSDVVKKVYFHENVTDSDVFFFDFEYRTQLYGKKGSFAETFADTYHLEFVPVN